MIPASFVVNTPPSITVRTAHDNTETTMNHIIVVVTARNLVVCALTVTFETVRYATSPYPTVDLMHTPSSAVSIDELVSVTYVLESMSMPSLLQYKAAQINTQNTYETPRN
jgi:hypothetical protein